MSEFKFPEEGILWRGWNDETLIAIAEKNRPVLLFVADSDPFIWPFLREILHAMPANGKLRALLHEFFFALLIKVDDLPDQLKELGAGSAYHIAVLSPYGLTPMVTIDPVNGKPVEVVTNIVSALERLVDVWRC